LTYSNRLNAEYPGPNGNRWFIKEVPQLGKDGSGNIAVIGIINDTLWFDKSGSNYVARFFIKETLVESTANKEFTFTDTQGRAFRFFNFDATIPVVQQGQFKYSIDPYQHLSSSSSATYNASSSISSYVMSDGTNNFGHNYEYSSSSTDKIIHATQTVNGTTNVRRAVMDYYPSDTGTGADAFGSAGDLRKVTVQIWNSGTSAWDDATNTYYRYYKTGDANGFKFGLKYVVNPESYARMVLAGLTPETATDVQVAAYADNYYQYDSNKRVTLEKTRGGLLSYSYAYTQSANADGYNSWKMKTVETLPDTNQNIVYTNYAGQLMLKIFNRVSDNAKWYEFNKYDSAGRLLWWAESSAVTGYDDTKADLLNSVGGNYQYLSDNGGLIHVYDYYTTTDLPNGAVAGYLQFEKIRQGELGTDIKIKEYQYTSQTVGSTTIYPTSKDIAYPSDTDQTLKLTTAYTYAWYASTFQVQQKTTTWPAVSTAQNGSGATTSRVENFDEFGRVTWLKDERGFLTRWKYDNATGGLVQRIDDVQTSQITDAPAVPTGWTTPTGGGLHLITDDEYDNLGRTTQQLGPSHSVDLSGTATTIRRANWTVYKDTTQERWEGFGYATGTAPTYTYTLINPVSIWRYDRANRLKDAIRATRASTSGRLTAADSFAQSSWVRWSNYNFDDNGRSTYTRLYFLIPSTGVGTSGTNYNETDYAYTSTNVSQNKVKTPGGTVTRTVFHARGWALEKWIGTDDTGATDSNPGGAAPNNMVKVEAYEYDSNAAGGNGTLTKVTRYQDSTTTRVTTYGYDFRNRRTSQAGEVNVYEAYTYDNLSFLTQTDAKNGTGGVLISRTVNMVDNQRRVYQQVRYAVNVSTGNPGNTLTDNFWFDESGNRIKFKLAGSSALIKIVYDGAARLTKQYVSYDTAETAYADAFNVTGDTVMNQAELSYDAASNMIQQTMRARFHDATGTGELTSPSGAQPKARVSYSAIWPDPLGREKAVADYGTNGGSALSRPATVPGSSTTVLVVLINYNSRGEANQITDPKGIVTQVTFDDANRMTQNIEDYGASPHLNRETDSAYNADGRLKTLTAINSVTGNQVTKYVYGTTLNDSDVASNDLLRAVIYPDSDDTDSPLGNGADGIYDRVEFKCNRLSETKEKKDQLQTIHTLEYDKLGRLLNDRVTAFGTGVDQAVKRITRSYEVRGLLQNVTSYDNATVGSGTVLNDVQFAYNDFAQLITEYQSHSGAVNTGGTPKVQYAYADGSANHVRRTSMTYPDGRVTTYDYGAANGTDDLLSRITSLKQGTTIMAGYSYLGLDRAIKVSYSSEPGVDLTYIKQSGEADGDAGDQYTGLDRFGRVYDQRWIKTSTGTALERIQYGFDQTNNRTFHNNVVAATLQDEFYTYDNLNQLLSLQRGTLNAGRTAISGTPTREEDFTFDPTGNWHGTTTGYLTKTSGTTDLDQNRTHNKANEITGITTNSGPAWVVPAEDMVGNMTTIPQPLNLTSSYTCIYDAWNRLVQIKSGANTVATHAYDGGTRRITKAGSSTRHYYYSEQWQIVEERLDTSVCPERQFVWGTRYIDDLVLRDRRTSSSTSSSPCSVMNDRLYVLHDFLNATAIVDTTGAVLERYGYDAFGNSRVMDANFAARASSNYDWETRYGAYRWDSESGLYQIRNRFLHSKLGCWLGRDVLEYREGTNLYVYAKGNPVNFVDPLGTRCILKVSICWLVIWTVTDLGPSPSCCGWDLFKYNCVWFCRVIFSIGDCETRDWVTGLVGVSCNPVCAPLMISVTTNTKS
jgi:RHS repeat-associated protein